MKSGKKWQIPVLVIGVLLLGYFGVQTIKTFRTAGGAAAPPVVAKAPEHVKERAPVAEATPTGRPATATAPKAPVAGKRNAAEELAVIQLPAGDILRPLETKFAPLPVAPGTELAGAPGPLLPGPALPPVTLVGTPGPARGPEAAPAATSGAASRIRKRGSGFPPILPERAEKVETIRCLGTITGRRRIAILTDLSAPEKGAVLFVAEGDRIPGPKRLVVSKVEPGRVTIRTEFASTVIPVERRDETGGAPALRGSGGAPFARQ